MIKQSRIFVPQQEDMVGAAIVRALRRHGYENILLRSESAFDLMNEVQVDLFFASECPEYVFCFAGPHGGISKNTTYPADLIYANLKIQCAILHSAYKHGVKKLLFMAGGCIYPVDAPQPVTENSFMTGVMEPTSAAYSTARAAGVEMCRAYNKQYHTCFIPAVLTNYYGPGDDYSDNGHVLASVLRKMCQAKENGDSELFLWGTGEPKRQFMFVDDIAEAAVLVMERYENAELINIAGGQEFSISEMTKALKTITGYNGKITFDSSKPNGAMRKLLDDSKLKSLGFSCRTSFEDGLKEIYRDYITHKQDTELG